MTEKNLEKGFIKVYRSIWENPICEKPNYLSVWIYLLSHANFNDKETIINNKKILIERGTFIGSILGISKQFKMSIGTVSNILKYLKSENQIEIKTNNKFTLFKIINYNKYNQIESKVENKMKTKVKQNETTNKEKNVKNVKNIAKTSFAINPIKEFSLKDKLELMVKDKNRHIQIIAFYWFYKSIKFENEIQYKAGITRDLRPASRLKGYNLERIKETMFWLNGTEIDWTLETVHKYIDKDLNKLTEEGGLFYGGEEKTLNINNKNYATLK